MSEKLSGDFRKFMDKSFLGSWDVPDGSDLVLTIDYVSKDEVQNEKGREKKLAIHFKERDAKPMICNVTNAKRIAKAYGTNKVEQWAGKKISIYTEKVTAFGGTTDALRIRDYPPKTDEYICSDCGLPVTDHGNSAAKVIANRAITRFGRALCYDCAVIASEQEGKNAAAEQ